MKADLASTISQAGTGLHFSKDLGLCNDMQLAKQPV